MKLNQSSIIPDAIDVSEALHADGERLLNILNNSIASNNKNACDAALKEIHLSAEIIFLKKKRKAA